MNHIQDQVSRLENLIELVKDDPQILANIRKELIELTIEFESKAKQAQ